MMFAAPKGWTRFVWKQVQKARFLCATKNVPKPVLPMKDIRDRREEMKENIVYRKCSGDVDLAIRLYEEQTLLRQRWDLERASQKHVRDREEGLKIKKTLGEIEERLRQVSIQAEEVGLCLPNFAHKDAPKEEMRVVKVSSAEKRSEKGLLDHVELGKRLGVMDFEVAARTSGSKFVFLLHEAALLELALVQWTMVKAVKHGFVPVLPPDIIRRSVLHGCGFRPRVRETEEDVGLGEDSFGLDTKEAKCLAGTAELPMAGAFAGQVLDGSQFPLLYVAFGHCFRAEAGSQGKQAKGLYRLHQFSKVELFALTENTEQASQEMLHRLLDLECELYDELGFHYRVCDMPLNELGAPAARKYDIEAWMPGRGEFGEVCLVHLGEQQTVLQISSASDCTDYQARRLGIRFRDEQGKMQFAHTVNATACAVPRVLLTLLENGQQSDGTWVFSSKERMSRKGLGHFRVKLPSVLGPFMGGKLTLKPRDRGMW